MRATAWREPFCTALMIVAISFVEPRVRSASSRISSATTVKPAPCSPACAAMIAAFSARRFVRFVTSSMTLRIWLIWPTLRCNSSSVSAVRVGQLVARP